jgi:WhiB family redox-sensing transcriptional regulator
VADTQRLPAPLTDNWDWQTQATCRGMDITVFIHPPDERNAHPNAAPLGRKPSARPAPPYGL